MGANAARETERLIVCELEKERGDRMKVMAEYERERLRAIRKKESAIKKRLYTALSFSFYTAQMKFSVKHALW